MKKFIILPLLLIAFTLSAQDFAPVGAKWCYEESQGTSPQVPDIPYLYQVEKDSLINDSLYAVVKWKKAESAITEGTALLYREVQNKVYIRISGKNYLLYNFGLMLGDSIKYTISEENIPTDLPIYNMITNGVREYGYTITHDSTADILSAWGMQGKISSKYGNDQNLFGRSSAIYPADGYEMHIRGYKDSSYEMGSLQACDVLLSEKRTSAIKTSLVSVKTAPGNVVNIHVTEGFGAYEAAVVDMQGKEVMRPKKFTGNASIKLSGLSPAVYVVKISGGAGFSQGFLVPVE